LKIVLDEPDATRAWPCTRAVRRRAGSRDHREAWPILAGSALVSRQVRGATHDTVVMTESWKTTAFDTPERNVGVPSFVAAAALGHGTVSPARASPPSKVKDPD
jgi:hypothetical protein